MRWKGSYHDCSPLRGQRLRVYFLWRFLITSLAARLYRTVAEAYLHGPQAGLDRLSAVAPENIPARYPGWYAVIGELHYRLGHYSAAEHAWQEALRLTTASTDQDFLRRRLANCQRD
jgi:predicted RNA polymerase sigma factor